MPYGRSYRKKAKSAFKKVVNKRVAKRLGKKIAGKLIPGYNVVSTVDDIIWLGSKGYRLLKNRQRNLSDKTVDAAMERSNSPRPKGRGRRKRYGIDDYY
jgi:hypothetical protein